jgi:cyclophilin family peptidyl-prolyl cis-trans isomerase
MKHVLLAALALSVVCPAVAAPPVHTQQVLSKVYTIDRKYRSMEGPSAMQRITLGDPAKPELLWIVGMRTEMVGADGKTPQLPELMCHVNVDIEAMKHQVLFDFQRTPSARLMTLSQGMLEAKLPPGFGFPIASNEPLVLFTQVLNHNIEHPDNLEVRHRVTFEYIRDAEVTTPMHALFNVGASGMVQLENNPLALKSMMPSVTEGMTAADVAEHGANCIVGSRAPQAAASAADYVDPSGRKMTGHWTVPPGRQVNASDISWFMQLPYDSKVHYAAFHLHPFAESLSIRDLTTGKTIMKAMAKNPDEGVGLTHVDTIESIEGIPLFKEHKYDLVSVYNNTSKADADSMASVFLGMEDPEFVHEPAGDFSSRAVALLDSTSIVIHTTAGDLKAQLFRETAPMTSLQVARLVQAGVFNQASAIDGKSHVRIAVPMTPVLMRKLLALNERAGTFERGTVAYCTPSPTANEISLRVITDPAAPQDPRCKPFARLIEGMDIIEAIEKAPVATSASVKTAAMSR